MSDEEYETGGSGASQTYPVQCSALRKNGYVMLKDKPCKIVEMSTSKTGKHGHAKVHLTGIDIFTNKKYEDISPSTHNMNVPHVKRAEFTVVDVNEGYLTLMDDSGETRDDIKVPESLEGIKSAFDEDKTVLVTVLSAMGNEAVITFKLAND